MNKRAQSMLEYTLLIGIVALALMAMQTYGRRGIQAVLKLSVDKLGAQENATSSVGGFSDVSTEPESPGDDTIVSSFGEGMQKTVHNISRSGIEGQKNKGSSGVLSGKKGSFLEVDTLQESESPTGSRDKPLGD